MGQRLCWLLFVQLLLLLTIQARLQQSAQAILQADLHDNVLSLEDDEGFTKFVEELLEGWHVPGLSVAVVRANTVSARGYGYASFPDTNATAETLYFTGSTTKAFTAAAAGMLVHDAKLAPNLRWTSCMHDLLPEDFVLSDEYATNHITLEDALSHRTGLPRHDWCYGDSHTTSGTTKKLRHLPMTAEPRTRFQYNNMMFGAVGDLIEKLTGKSLGVFLTENIWGPLGMRSTFFTLGSVKKANAQSKIARGYFWHDDTTEVARNSDKNTGYFVPEPYLDISPIAGAGATISSVADYAIWIQALLKASNGHGLRNASSPITTSLYSDVTAPRTIINAEALGGGAGITRHLLSYSLGWIMSENQVLVLSHGGGLTGFGTELFIIPQLNVGVVTMGNTAVTSNQVGALVAQYLLKRMLGLSVAEEVLETSRLTRASLGLPNLKHNIQSTKKQNFKATNLANDGIPMSKTFKQKFKPSDYIGLYNNPGYGTFNISQVTSLPDIDIDIQSHPTKSATTSSFILRAILPSRLWKLSFYLHPHPSSPQFFTTQIYQPHGPHQPDPIPDFSHTFKCGANPICKDDKIVWDTLFDEPSLSYFEVGPTGRIERLGVQIEGEMVSRVEREERETGRVGWRDSMVWFDRL